LNGVWESLEGKLARNKPMAKKPDSHVKNFGDLEEL
jgi:hypothetical protein